MPRYGGAQHHGLLRCARVDTPGTPLPKEACRPIEYAVDDVLSPEDLREILSGPGSVGVGESRAVSRTFLDTFDGRLCKRGFALEIRDDGSGPQLEGRSSIDGALLGRAASPSGRFVTDLEPGRLRAKLEPVVEMRALLPLARLRGTSQGFELRNRDGKLVVRVFLEAHAAAAPDQEAWSPLRQRIRLEPLRGYAKGARAAAARIEARLAVHPCGTPLLCATLEAIGRSPPEYSSKVRVSLRPEQRAEEATRTLLLQLLETMRANEEGTRLDLDSEFLHDFRVAVRRTRAALGQIKGVFPAAFVSRFAREFAWLGSVTGPARDLDVYLLSLPSYRRLLPKPLRADLDPLEDLLRTLQRKEQRRVARALQSRRYGALVASWRESLERGVAPEDAPPPNAARPVIEVASERIRKVLRRVRKEGRAIGPDSPPSQFHELRKTCKKLRYLLEFFQSLYPPDAVKKLVRALKTLQDNLGEYQDLSVQIASMGRFEAELERSGADAGPTLRALATLVEAFHRRQDEVRSKFAECFAEFTAGDTRATLDGALRASEPAGKGGAA